MFNQKIKLLILAFTLSLNFSCGDETPVNKNNPAPTTGINPITKNPESTSANSYIPENLAKQIKEQEQIAKEALNISKNGANPKTVTPYGSTEKDWGTKAQIAGTSLDLKDLRGNKDGIWENERQDKNIVLGLGNTDLRTWIVNKPDTEKKDITSTVVLKELNDFLTSNEQKWGIKASTLDPNNIKAGKLFIVQKAINLVRYNRQPAEVGDGFLKTGGSVSGYQSPSREIFWQRFKPIGNPIGKLVIVMPDYPETGRNYLEQVNKLNKLGYDAVIIDPQWAGQSKYLYKGTIDRGYGLVADLAFAAGVFNIILEREYKSINDREIIFLGSGLGATTALMTAALNDNDKILLDRGVTMPKGIKVVAESFYLPKEEKDITLLLNDFSQNELYKKLVPYSPSFPTFSYNEISTQKAVQLNILEDSDIQYRAFPLANKDIQDFFEQVKNGLKPFSEINIIASEKNKLISYQDIENLKTYFGDKLKIKKIDGENHSFSLNPKEQDYVIDIFKTFISSK
ncbi:MAG: hypothetical protein U0457_07590 [Candidatus Sericytochromatia bacterium]